MVAFVVEVDLVALVVIGVDALVVNIDLVVLVADAAHGLSSGFLHLQVVMLQGTGGCTPSASFSCF